MANNGGLPVCGLVCRRRLNHFFNRPCMIGEIAGRRWRAALDGVVLPNRLLYYARVDSDQSEVDPSRRRSLDAILGGRFSGAMRPTPPRSR